MGAIVLVVASVLGGAWFFEKNSSPLSYSANDPAYNTAYWRQEFKIKNPREAYKEFINVNAEAPQDRKHFAAHVMGELLYTEGGVDNLVVCDATFDFGCYHGFFGRAISESGIEGIEKLDAVCVEAFGPLGTGCQHGMGHGIMEYVGKNDVTSALALCARTTQLVPLLGCTSGVFMEYNTPLANTSDGQLPSERVFDPKNPHTPCPSVTEEYKASCYYELGQWIDRPLRGDSNSMQEVCSSLDASDRKHCYLGIGAKIAHTEKYDPDRAKKRCASFALDDETACRAGVSWSYYSLPEQREKAQGACMFPEETRSEECALLADLTEGRDGT